MYSLDLTLKYSPMPVSVQRKDDDSARTLYQSIVDAMRSGNATVIELTCDKEEDKKIALMSDQISAVSLNKKSGAAAAGRVPGFFATQSAE
jgi:hypothetical protein